MEKKLWVTPVTRELEIKELISLADLDVAFAVWCWCSDVD